MLRATRRGTAKAGQSNALDREAIAVAEDLLRISESLLKHVVEHKSHWSDLLTPRERLVLYTFVRTCDVKAAAKQLGTHSRTIRSHLTSVRRKLKIPTLTLLAMSVAVALVCETALGTCPSQNDDGQSPERC